jgi:hypothetical protein
MQSVLEPQPHYRVIHHTLKDSLSPIYLTLLSVIQGVALADLALVVAANYQQFTLIHWLLVLFNFGVLIGIWNHYMMNNKLWSWIPDLRDAIVPFMIGALELVFNHTISLSLSAWLFLMAIIASSATLAIWYVGQRAKEESENTQLLGLLRRQHRLFALYNLGASALYLLLAVISHAQSLEASNGVQTGQGLFALALVLLVAACVAGVSMINTKSWNLVVSYSRTGRIPGT